MGRIKDYLEMDDRLATIPLKFAMAYIQHLPSADVELVRHGEWRLVRRMADCGEYECSVCGRIETFGCFNKPENNPYCHCGAKMDLEGEN